MSMGGTEKPGHRVLIISTMGGNPWGGSEFLWKQAAAKLIKEGHHVELSVYNWGRRRSEHIIELEQQGAVVRTRGAIHSPSLVRKPATLLRRRFFAKRQIARDLHRARPDVVLISCGSLSELLLPGLPEAFLDASIGGRKSTADHAPYEVVFQTNLETQAFPVAHLERIRQFLDGAKAVHFVSNRLIQQARRQLVWAGDNAQLVHNPVNLDLSEAQQMEWPNKQGDSTVRWACVGRLECATKGQLLLLQVLASAKWRARSWALEFFGEGPDRALIQEAIRTLKLEDRVKLAGFTRNVADIWRTRHALILPSYYEGQPLSLQEAMACGRVAVGTDVGGMADLLCETSPPEKTTGFLAEAPLPIYLDAALERAWNARDRWPDIGQTAREHLTSFRGDAPIEAFVSRLIQGLNRP